jgi:hypothetical protein
MIMDEGYFTKAIALLKIQSSSKDIKVGVLNLILNMTFKEQDGSETRIRRQIMDMDL